MEYIQERIRSQHIFRNGKIDVLVNYWDKILGKLTFRAGAVKDRDISEITRKICLIP